MVMKPQRWYSLTSLLTGSFSSCYFNIDFLPSSLHFYSLVAQLDSQEDVKLTKLFIIERIKSPSTSPPSADTAPPPPHDSPQSSHYPQGLQSSAPT
jgi:hypothetical protein